MDRLSRGLLEFQCNAEITKESTWFVFNLALVNYFLTDVWAEECTLTLSEFNGKPSNGFEAKLKGHWTFVSSSRLARRYELTRAEQFTKPPGVHRMSTVS